MGGEDEFTLRPKRTQGGIKTPLESGVEAAPPSTKILEEGEARARQPRKIPESLEWHEVALKPPSEGPQHHVSEASIFAGSLGSMAAAGSRNHGHGETPADSEQQPMIEADFISAEEEDVTSTAAMIKYLKDRGDVTKDSAESSHSARNHIRLEHRDKEGNILNAKEAYKELSRKFHGTGIGKRRIERKLQRDARSGTASGSVKQDVPEPKDAAKVVKARGIFGME